MDSANRGVDPDCIPYALTQVLATARLVTEDPWIHRKVLLRALADLAAEPDLDKTAPEIIFTSVTTAYKALGVSDPFEKEKARSNKAVGGLEAELRQEIDKSDDPLNTALGLALAGSVLNTPIRDRGAAEAALAAVRNLPPAIDDRPALLKALGRAEKILYILNNAGEAILDRLLVEQLAQGRAVTVVVRHAPILDDVILKEAEALGFGDIEGVELIDPGAPMLGLWLEQCSKALRKRFREAEVVISKGQANYESLCLAEREIFFLMRARGEAVARHIGVETGSLVIMRHRAGEKPERKSATKRQVRK